MRREVIPFTSKEKWLEDRSKVISSTDMAALFHASPYGTEFELYHRHADGIVSDFDPNERVVWGTRLQDAIASGIAEDQGWDVQPMTEFMSIPELKIGASFDYRIVVGDEPGPEDGLLEIKNVDALVFRDGWIIDDEGEVEAPPHIEIQLQTQMFVSGLKWGYIGALVGGNKVKLLRRVEDKDVQSAIVKKSRTHWSRINAKDAPTPDFKRDAEFISQLYQRVDAGKTMAATDEIEKISRDYSELGRAIKDYQETRDALKAQLLMQMGDSEKVIGDKFSISAGTVKESLVKEYIRKPYRGFRVTFRKGKENV